MSHGSARVSGGAATVDFADLLRRAGEGDRAAEGVLVERVRAPVRAFARRRLRGPEMEELAQDVLLLFIEAIRNKRIAHPAQLGSFALGICRNLARDRARAAERRRELWDTYGPVDEPTMEGPHVGGSLPHGALEHCIAQLTQRARQVIRHAVIDGDTNGEIAATLSLSEGNVRVIRHRALAQLRECLDRPTVWSAP